MSPEQNIVQKNDKLSTNLLSSNFQCDIESKYAEILAEIIYNSWQKELKSNTTDSLIQE
jgi:hypothetical protein